MKKILFLTVMTLLLIGCSFKTKEIIELDYNTYEQKINSNESFVLYIGSSTCSHCATFRPKLEKIVKKYKLDVYYLDVSKLSEGEYNKLTNKTFIKGTPTIVYFEVGKYSGQKLIGDKDKNEIINYFKDIEYIGD